MYLHPDLRGAINRARGIRDTDSYLDRLNEITRKNRKKIRGDINSPKVLKALTYDPDDPSNMQTFIADDYPHPMTRKGKVKGKVKSIWKKLSRWIKR